MREALLGRAMVGMSGIFFAGSAATAKRAINLGAPPFQVSFVRGTIMLVVTLSAML